MDKKLLFTDASLLQGDRVLPDGYVAIRGETIAAVGQGPAPEAYHNFERVDLAGAYLSPGFIDAHCHGGGGADFMDGTLEAILTAARAHMRHGTTSIAPTTVTCPDAELFRFFDLYDQALAIRDAMPNLMGIHLEGPVIALSQAGAQPPEYIRAPSAGYAREVMEKGRGHIIRWSLAPELPGALEMADFLQSQGILLSIAHTEAMYPDVLRALDHGFTHMTHFYSSMPLLQRVHAQRVLGAVEAGYLLDEMHLELIADGKHLPPELLRLILKCKAHDHLSLITDSMRGATLPEGPSWLGSKDHGIPVILEDGVAKLLDHSAFAGSIATTDRLVRVMVQQAGMPVAEAVQLITENPAKLYGLFEKVGSIAPGKQADRVVFDQDIRIQQVYVRGTRVQ